MSHPHPPGLLNFISFELVNDAMNNRQSEKNWKAPFFLRIIGMGKPYFVKTPWWLKKIYSSYIWSVKTEEKILYLTFDDGPHPAITDFVLDELKKYNAKATFFCIGKNVRLYPDVYKRILDEGHATGNHTYSHWNGWKTKNEIYIADVAEAAKYINSDLFRPPYGRIRYSQTKQLATAMGVKKSAVIMWDVLSADFDQNISSAECLKKVVSSAKKGSIIVFHDSEKAFPRLEYTLEAVLKFFSAKGYRFEALSGFGKTDP